MKITHLLSAAACFAAFATPESSTMAAEEIGFIERYALAADRDAVLDELIPGTEDYYYFHALHHQTEGRYGEVEQVLEPWIKRYGETAQVWEIRNRQALLLYPNQPEKSLAYLSERLGLRFDHQRQEIGKKPNLPTSLDAQLISWEAFLARAFSQSSELEGVEDSALDRMLRTDIELDPTRRRSMLSRLQYPDYPNLVGLIAADLRTKESRGFGEHPIHRLLLPTQLDELAGLRPELATNQEFIHTRLAKLAPSEDVDWRRDAVEREAYLVRMWNFVKPLPEAFNSLKAHVLYQLLAHHRGQGEYPRQLFLDYVKLPRPVPYAEPRWLSRPEHRGGAEVDLNSDFRAVTQMPPIGGRDEELVRDYLAQLFIEDDSWEGFAPYLRDTWLKPLFAEAKIVNGIGDAEKWASLLSPTAFKALRDRVDVEFVPSNAVEFADDEAVKLDLNIKNVETLMVKVYEINALNFYLEEKREINTDLNLDGLVSNSEQTQAYAEAPLRRVRRSFEFPELAGRRGTWVIEFIGNGISSRALVRKGRLQYLAYPSAAGTVLTVLDANNEAAKSPAVWFGGRRYTPDEKNLIVVPFSNQPGGQPVVLTDGENGEGASGDLATLETLNLMAENYQLEAGFHVDRESLLPGQRTTVAVRPRLTLNGAPVPTSLLENVRLKVGFVDADGIESINDVEDFKLNDDRESEYVFRVPERVRSIAFALEARVEKISAGGEMIDLSTADGDAVADLFQLNQIDDSEFVGDINLAKIDGGYVLEVLGKTGEVLTDRAVRLTLKHEDFRGTIDISLKSNATGRVHLGKLGGIAHLSSSGSNLPTRSWPLAGDRHTYTSSLNAAEGGVLEVPLMALRGDPANPEKLVPADAALFELRGGNLVDSRFDALSIADGLVRIKGLVPGDYRLVLRPPSAAASTAGRVIELRVTRGTVSGGYVLGQDRHLQVKNPTPLQVASLSADGDTVRIQLTNADAFTRVHVAATHFVPDYPLFPQLGTPMAVEPIAISRGSAESRYVSGRDIGEEYRYILERRDMEKFPGNMLARPGLILNPWELSKTETAIDLAEMGEGYQKSEASKASSRGGSAKRQAMEADAFAADERDLSRSLDFLFRQSVVFYNLTADDKGVITIKRSDLSDRQQLHVLAVNTANAAYRELSLPEVDGGTGFADLRLTRSLDVDEHFSQRRKVTVLLKDGVLRIPDRRASEMEVYDTVAGIYATLSGISNDPTLAEFSFVTRWPSLDAARKTELYSKYACHELNFFLSRRDPDFFATVVAPYLANKKDKTFLDDYLLNAADLSRHLEAWRYGRLNTVERILLAHRLGDQESAATARFVREGWELLPVDPGEQQHRFFQALRGRAGTLAYGYAGTSDGLADNFARNDREVAGKIVDERRPGVEMKQLGREMQLLESAPASAPMPAMASAPTGRDKSVAFAAKKSKDDVVALAAVADMQDQMLDGAALEIVGGDLADSRELQRLRKQVRANFRKLEETSEWAENNYYHRPIGDQIAELITVNAFWRDYAAWDGKGGFYSREFPTAANSFAEMMLALSVLDLPFEAGEHQIDVEDQALTLTAASPAVVFHQEIEAVPVADDPPPVLVSQNFFREGDRVRYEGNEQVDKFVTDEFLTGVLYGGQVVVTNPTSSNQRLEVLLQVPVGALPANGSDYTRSRPVQLGAFSTERLEYFFYFPAASGDGEFAHYPVHVAKQEQAIAWGDAFRFKVVDELSIIDKSSWEYLSQHGSKREVIDYLEQNNAQRIDLGLIAWRVREDVGFMRQVIQLLDARHIYDATLWSYGIHHNLLPTARQFLLHREDFLAQSGQWLECELVSIEPVDRHWYQQLDYYPIVNARRHQLGRDRKILNDRFRGHYQELMKVLSYRSEFDASDELAISAYLLLQDRVGEGLARLERVEREQVASQLQFDYLIAYASLYRGEPATAAQIAAAYAEHPVDRWRERFAQVDAQVREINGAAAAAAAATDLTGGGEADRAQQQEALAASEPTFDFVVEGQSIAVTHRNLDQLQVNYYEMDLEFLFSSNPFVARDSSRFRFIRPNVTELKPLEAGAKGENGDASLAFDLPKRFQGKNVLIEIVGAGIRKAQAYYANDLSVQMVENYGHLQVRRSDNGAALPKVYVKVYARFDDGSVKFFKDGYTDLRGKFDYVSLNTDELGAVQRFAVLVMSEQDGALVREADPPQQ